MMAHASHRDEEEEKKEKHSSTMIMQTPLMQPIMHEDEPPRKKLIFSLNFPNDKRWKDALNHHSSMSQISMNTNDEINKILKNIGFLAFPNRFIADEEKCNILLGSLEENEFLFLNKQYRKNKTIPKFSFIEMDVVPSFYSKNKWDPIEKIEYKNAGKVTSYEMSWKYIDIALHNTHGLMPKYNKSIKIIKNNLYDACKNKGINKSILRASVVVNSNHEFAFYAIYSSKDELIKVKNVLNKIII